MSTLNPHINQPLFVIDEIRALSQALAGQCKGLKVASHISSMQGDTSSERQADLKLEVHDSLVNKFALYLLQSHGRIVSREFIHHYEKAVERPLVEFANGITVTD